MPTKKGILFYGPPGTGKTLTLHYLAGALPGHTTLLISAEQVDLLSEYMTLARLLQPSIVVLEDVDLIARERSAMGSPCEEVLLNKLLNEMDGLKEEADILFLLTTNRPESLEAALASRPGRIDQAIEFPLPDEAGRENAKAWHPATDEERAFRHRFLTRRRSPWRGKRFALASRGYRACAHSNSASRRTYRAAIRSAMAFRPFS